MLPPSHGLISRDGQADDYCIGDVDFDYLIRVLSNFSIEKSFFSLIT